MTETCAEAHDLANVVTFPGENPRKTTFTFACGCSVTVAAPDDHPPLTVEKTIYMLANAQHQIHRMMEPRRD